MVSSSKDLKKYVVILLVIAFMIFFFSSTKAFAQVKEKSSSTPKAETCCTTIREAKFELDNYISSTYPDIIIGSSEYVEFLTKQITLEEDETLLKMPRYNDYMVYAVRLISDINNEQKYSKVYIDKGEEKIGLSSEALDKTIAETKNDFKKENQKIERKAALTKDVSVNAMIGNYSMMATKGYSPGKAGNYGYNHGTSPNTPAYPYSKWSDCTNFVSQCVKHGGKSFKYAPGYKNKPKQYYETTKYWYSYHYLSTHPTHKYKQSTSFVRVNDFYVYWKNHGATVISCKDKKTLQAKAKKGDIVQLNNGAWHHSIIISRGSKGDWKYAAHSDNHKEKPISKISKNESFRIIRIK